MPRKPITALGLARLAVSGAWSDSNSPTESPREFTRRLLQPFGLLRPNSGPLECGWFATAPLNHKQWYSTTTGRSKLGGIGSTIDAAGRVVIPKEIRQLAVLGPGAAVEIRFENGQIEIEPLSVPIKLEREGQLLVAVPQTDIPPLTSEAVDALRRFLSVDVCHRG